MQGMGIAPWAKLFHTTEENVNWIVGAHWLLSHAQRRNTELGHDCSSRGVAWHNNIPETNICGD
jgi:hypothetical protein